MRPLKLIRRCRPELYDYKYKYSGRSVFNTSSNEFVEYFFMLLAMLCCWLNKVLFVVLQFVLMIVLILVVVDD